MGILILELYLNFSIIKLNLQKYIFVKIRVLCRKGDFIRNNKKNEFAKI